jgi:hypothetical protein
MTTVILAWPIIYHRPIRKSRSAIESHQRTCEKKILSYIVIYGYTTFGVLAQENAFDVLTKKKHY